MHELQPGSSAAADGVTVALYLTGSALLGQLTAEQCRAVTDVAAARGALQRRQDFFKGISLLQARARPTLAPPLSSPCRGGAGAPCSALQGPRASERRPAPASYPSQRAGGLPQHPTSASAWAGTRMPDRRPARPRPAADRAHAWPPAGSLRTARRLAGRRRGRPPPTCQGSQHGGAARSEQWACCKDGARSRAPGHRAGSCTLVGAGYGTLTVRLTRAGGAPGARRRGGQRRRGPARARGARMGRGSAAGVHCGERQQRERQAAAGVQAGARAARRPQPPECVSPLSQRRAAGASPCACWRARRARWAQARLLTRRLCAPRCVLALAQPVRAPPGRPGRPIVPDPVGAAAASRPRAARAPAPVLRLSGLGRQRASAAAMS